MQNNSDHKIQGWRQRLDHFEEDPAPCDLEAGWQHFQQKQLNQTVPSKKRSWYWIAAACLLTFVFLSAQFFNRFLIQTDSKKVSVKALPALLKNTSTGPDIITSTPKTEYVLVSKVEQTKNVISVLMPKKDSVLPLLSKEPIVIFSLPLSMIDSLQTTRPVLVLSAPKKLKVVHLNDINYPANRADLAAQEGKPYFRVNTPTKKLYGNSNLHPVKKDKDDLIRIKLFP